MNDNRLRKSLFPSLFHSEGAGSKFTSCANNLKRVLQFGLALLVVVGLGFSDSIAQERVTVTGTVTDANDGSVLPGVNVTVQGSAEATGSTIGTTTNMDGEYEIRVPENLNVLVFSFIGYQSQQVDIDGRTTIDVELGQDLELLDDVVVVGYGVQDRREITSSVASVSADQFNRGNINDAQELLQGKVSGLQITRPGGDPNADFTIRLRGLSTIGANQEPLVVIDGVPGADFQSVDPNDIESMEVLKDASASAIYGTRGASGVILITTKSGEPGGVDGMTVNYNGQVSTSLVANRYNTLTADEYRSLQDLGISITDLGSSTDFWEEVTQNAYTQSHSLAISGGDAQTSYRVSGNYRDVQGIQKGSGNERLNARLNITHRALDDRLTLTGNLSVTNRDQQIGLGEAFRYATTFNPTAPVRNDDGTLFRATGFDNFNPVAINELTTFDVESSRFTMSLRGQYDFSDIVDGLSASAFYSRERANFLTGQYYSRDLRFRGSGRNGLAIREENSNRDQLFETTVNYRNSFDAINVESVAGYTYEEFESQGQFAEGGDFSSDTFLYNNLGFAREFDRGLGTVNSFRNESKLIAFFARTNLTFQNTYFLSGTFRHEGSTRFGPGNKWGNFFAASAGVELTNLVNIPEADEFKLRVSYGETGQQPPFDGISQLQFSQGSSFLVDGNFVPSLGPAANPNPDLRWEIKKEWNAGIDYSFFDDRLTGALDYYNARTEDLLLEFQVPVPPNLAPAQWVNIGEISNEGFEAVVNYVAVQDTDFTWTTGLTFSTNSATLESLSSGDFQFGESTTISNMGAPGLNDTDIIRVKEGRPIGEIWGPRFAGVAEDGSAQYFDIDGNIVSGGDLTSADNQVIGNGLPDFDLGFDNTINYRNWDLNMFWRGSFGHDLVNTYDVFYNFSGQASTWNVSSKVLESDLRGSPRFSSLQVEDASFVRLENLTLGYNFDLPETIAIRDLRFYVSGNNLWTITNYTGVDPEVRYSDAGAADNAGFADGGPLAALAPGIERRNQWFTQTSLVFGVNIGF